MSGNLERKVAFVTGASRGIGKQAAIALAARGFDVVLAARSMEEGERHERGADNSDTSPVSGSLLGTAAQIEALGRRALPIRLDLLDTASIEQALATTFEQWGQIDLLLNNGIYQGPGTMKPVLELTGEMVHKIYQGNVFAPLLLVQRCLPAMLARNSGCIINMVSNSATTDPPAPTGAGGWGFAYSSTKAALMRMVGVLHAEHRDSGVHFFNVDPGFVPTENMREKGLMGDFTETSGNAPATVPAAVIAWLASAPEAAAHNAQTICAQPFCVEHRLLDE